MAKLNIIICDLCKSMSKLDLSYILSLQSGKGKDKEVKRAEICKKCYEGLAESIDSEFDFNTSFSQNTRTPRKIEVAAGETIVPSLSDNVAPPPKADCSHDKKQFEPPFVICRECGDKWKA